MILSIFFKFKLFISFYLYLFIKLMIDFKEHLFFFHLKQINLLMFTFLQVFIHKFLFLSIIIQFMLNKIKLHFKLMNDVIMIRINYFFLDLKNLFVIIKII